MNKDEVLKEIATKFNDSNLVLINNKSFEVQSLELSYDCNPLPIGLLSDDGCISHYPFSDVIKTGKSSYKISINGSYSIELALLKAQQF